MPKPDAAPFVRIPINFTPDNLAAIDRAVIDVRAARGRGRYITRAAIINLMVESADFGAIVKELTK